MDGIGGKTHDYNLLYSGLAWDAEAAQFIQITGRAACRQFVEIPGSGSVQISTAADYDYCPETASRFFRKIPSKR